MTDILFGAKDPIGGAVTLQTGGSLIGLVVSDADPTPHTAAIVLEKENRAGFLAALRRVQESGLISIELAASAPIDPADSAMEYVMTDFAGGSLTVHSALGTVALAASDKSTDTAIAFLFSEGLGELIGELEKLADVEDLTIADLERGRNN